MTQKIIWTIIFFCCIRGIYANITKKEWVWSAAFIVIFVFSIYMLADLFGMVPPGTIEALFGQKIH